MDPPPQWRTTRVRDTRTQGVFRNTRLELTTTANEFSQDVRATVNPDPLSHRRLCSPTPGPRPNPRLNTHQIKAPVSGYEKTTRASERDFWQESLEKPCLLQVHQVSPRFVYK